jgi:hypothetical protein
VSGLIEIRRMATSDEIAGLVGVYYALAYVGFLAPALLAGLSTSPVMLATLSCIALSCTLAIGSAYRKHLPTVAHAPRDFTAACNTVVPTEPSQPSSG